MDLDSKGSKETLMSYNELFYTKGVLQKKIFLLGDAGAGKTTFCKHLTDEWCNPTPNQQFDDVDVLQQYPFLFYVSCRFAEKNDTVLEMIKNQLFDNDEIRDIACNVLKHNSNSCFIVIDGYDELQRTALAETGKPGDITGLPSLTGVQNCVLFITSRPWKFFSIPKDEQEMFSRLELDGIKDPAELVEIIFHKHQMPDPAKICSDFLADINERNMSELIKYPLMLIFAIDVWLQNESLPKSVCLCYINMIKLSIDRFETKGEKVNIDNTKTGVEKFLDSSKPGKPLPNVFSNFKCVQRTACLFYSLGHLASDLLLGQEKQSLVFQKDVCERYKICDDDGSLKRCLDLGLLTKLESTVRGIKQKENFQFCHSSFQEFFAALWLSTKNNEEESQENLNLYTCIKNEESLLNYSLLIQFICGLCPEAGTDFWANIAQKNIILLKGKEIQDLILKSVKEAHECCDHQGKHVYYCIPRVYINKDTSDEDISLLCKMISQYNSTYLKCLKMENDIILSSVHYHCLLSSVACATNLTTLELHSISCQQNDNSDRLPALDLQKHHKLEALSLDKISISDLVLPSQGESELSKLYLHNLGLSHDSLVQLCTSLSSLSSLQDLILYNLSCSDDGGSCCLSGLDQHKHHKLETLGLNKISISGLILPSQEESKICKLYLDNLVLSHDNLVQLCSSLSSLSSLEMLVLDNMSCSDDGGSCRISVLGLHKHHKLKTLSLGKISISSLVLPSQGESGLSVLRLDNLVLPHDNLVQLCSSLSSLSSLETMILDNLSCSGNGGSCRISMLDLHTHQKLKWLKLDKISISSLVLPSQGESGLSVLCLDNLVLSHDNLVQLCSSLSSLSSLEELVLVNLSCSDDGGSCRISVLDLHKHHKLKWLHLDKISISSLILPSQGESGLSVLRLDNLVLSHDNLVQLCSSLSSLSSLQDLRLVNLSCSDDGGSCRISVLYLHKHHKLELLKLHKISISGLILPSQEESKLYKLYLDNLVLSHDNLVQLCTSLSSLSSLERLQLDNMSCSDDGGSCRISVLDLHKHHKLKTLRLDKISISGLVLPSQRESGLSVLGLHNLVLSHDNLVQLCSSLSSLSSLEIVGLVNLSCSDDGDSCRISVLDLHKHHKLEALRLDKISISDLVLPSQGESELSKLYLYNLVLSHDNLVQLCSSLSSLSSLEIVGLVNLSCSDDGDSCRLSVLDLHKHHKLKTLILDKISISSLVLPSQGQSGLSVLLLNNLVLSHDNLVQLCSSLSSLSSLQDLVLHNLSCSDDGGSCRISVLDLHKHHKLETLQLDKISISGLILPSQGESELSILILFNLVLSHDNLVQLCSSLSSLSSLEELVLDNLSCSDDGDSCRISVLDLHKHHKLETLQLDKISISSLVLPIQGESELSNLYLYNLGLSHDNLVQLCSSLSSLSSLQDLRLDNLSCSNDGGSCRISVLDLHKHHKLKTLSLDKISISSLVLPSQGESELSKLCLFNLVLSHDNLVQLCSSLSSLSSLQDLRLDNLSCSDDGDSCRFSVLDLHKHHKLETLQLNKIFISSLVLPSQGESGLSVLYLYNLGLSRDNLVQLCSSLSSLSSLQDLRLDNLSCSDDGGSCLISVLDLHKHHKLKTLSLDKISISSLVLPSQGESELSALYLNNLGLSHDNLVQLCSSLSSLSSLQVLRLDNLSCSDDGGSCLISVLDLHKPHKLETLILDKISISSLVLPSQGESELSKLYLYNLVLSHDNLVQLCTSLSSLSSLQDLRLDNLSCSDDGGSCCLSVLDLHRLHKLKTLSLDKISISSLVLPSQRESELSILYLVNLVLLHDNLVQLCTSLSSLSSLQDLRLHNLSCSDDGGSCCLSVLDLHRLHKLKMLSLNKISISSLVLPSQRESELSILYLVNLGLSHDNLVQLCSSLSSLSSLQDLRLHNLSCSDDGGSCRISVLDLHKHHKLEMLSLAKISISSLVLPSQGESGLSKLGLVGLLLSHDNLVQLCSSLSSLSSLQDLRLHNLSCSDDCGSCRISVLDLHKHHKLETLLLDKISISSLLLPSQGESELSALYLDNLGLSHDNLVQLCSSLSSLSCLEKLELVNLSCSDDGDSCHHSVLDLHKHHKLKTLILDKISISSLVLPSQGESELRELCLYNLVLSHDNLVQLCSSLSSLSSLQDLRLDNLSCSDDGGSCRISVLDLHKHHKLKTLSLNKISISSLVLPSQGESELSILYLYNLVLSHDNLVQLCSSLSSLSSLQDLRLHNLSCSDDGGSCRISVLDLHKHHKLEMLSLAKISISSLVLPSQGESGLSKLGLVGLLLSHDNLVQLCSSLSSLSSLQDLRLHNLSCSDDCGSCRISVLDLHKHHKLETLLLDKISISSLLLPSQGESELSALYLDNLGLSHDNLVQLCSSLSSLSCLEKLELVNLSCSDDGDSCHHSVLDLHKHHKLKTLILDKISISSLVLPSQGESELRELCLYNLVLSHDNLVQLFFFTVIIV